MLAKYRAFTSLNTNGLGPQNLTSIFLMFSWSALSSRHHFECSAADGPAVGSNETQKDSKYKYIAFR